MTLTCPKCDKTNNCTIIDYENDLYQCCHCGHKFNEQDSLDHDWDKLMKRYYTEITPEMCLQWISVIGKERKKMESTWGSFGFERSFKHHFRINYKECDQETFDRLRIQVERDKKIDDII